MKPLPPPYVPGNTEAERFDNAVRKILTVSKEEIVKREAKWKRGRKEKKRAKKPARPVGVMELASKLLPKRARDRRRDRRSRSVRSSTAGTISTIERYSARSSGMVVCRVAMRRASFS